MQVRPGIDVQVRGNRYEIGSLGESRCKQHRQGASTTVAEPGEPIEVTCPQDVTESRSHARHDGFRIPFLRPDDAGAGGCFRQPVVARPPEIDAGARIEGHEPQEESVAGSWVGVGATAAPGCAVTVNINVQDR